MKMIFLLILNSWWLIITSCAGIEPKQPLTTVASVDLSRYAGTWHEIARLPMWFQRHCVHSTATYTIRRDGKIGVHNECLTDRRTVDQADGIATVVDSTSNARLMVTFDNFFARLVGPSREGIIGSLTSILTTQSPWSAHLTAAIFGFCHEPHNSMKRSINSSGPKLSKWDFLYWI